VTETTPRVDDGDTFGEAAVDAVDPGAVDAGAVDPGAVDPAAVDTGAVDPDAVDNDPVDPREIDHDVGAMAAHLRITATRLARLLRRQGDTGLSPSQLSALTSIERHGPMTLGDLADHERVAPPSITRVVAKLEELGFVDRRTDPDDRRISRVAATGAGRELLAHVRQRKDVWLASRLADLDDDQRARLAAALDVLDVLTGRDPA
jgi:DNA-binding MarR family transcriptional regulator